MKQSRKKYVKALLNIAVAIIVVLICIFVLPKIVGFFWPFVVGWIIALIANPLVHFLESKMKIKRKASSAVVIILVLALIILLAYLLVSKLVVEISSLVSDIPNMWISLEQDLLQIQMRLEKSVSSLRMNLDLSGLMENLIGWIQNMVENVVGRDSNMHAITNVAKNVPSAIIGVIMMILSAYCFVAQKDYVTKLLNEIAPESLRGIWAIIVGSCKKALGGYLKAQVQIEVWIYLLLVAGLVIIDVNYALLIALGIACLDFLPFFGTGAVMVPWAIVRLLSGDYFMALGLGIIWILGQLVRQMIQPRYVGNNVGLSAIPTLFLLYIGYKIGGVIGILLAVPIGIIVINMDEAGIFDNLKSSIIILGKGLNEFRKITPEDLEIEKNNKVQLMFQSSDEEAAIQEPIRTLMKEEFADRKDKKQKRKNEKKGNDL